MLLVAWAILGTFAQSVILAIVVAIIQTVVFVIHEHIWYDLIHWGRIRRPNNDDDSSGD
jgi:uncharacterized membrane protein